jgi:hypothetical protein
MRNKLLLCASSLLATTALAVWRGPDIAGMDRAIAPGNDFFRLSGQARTGFVPRASRSGARVVSG